ncbi:hypothetical protein TNCV_3291691 [Trichonephila clavipes]|nr:hypothetical protein TNCV_3291691 [Trichonephila clavipes]
MNSGTCARNDGTVGKASPLEVFKEATYRRDYASWYQKLNRGRSSPATGKNEWSTTLDELSAFISILYARVDVGNNHSKKLPETISFYTSTKFGVNITDQMARKYSAKAGSRRWPVHVFYNILDLPGID